jgi:DNA polymerase III subunit epsilon
MVTLIDDFPPLAFVDIETTGGNPDRDRITEIGVITLQEKNTHIWENLLDPGVPIPQNIQQLTGITPAMVQGKPSFAELSSEILLELKDKIFVAHNARFDYGFIRASFERLGIDFRAKVICTVKLSRLLFPQQDRHNLDTIIAKHGLHISSRHRALGDADLLLQFWQKCLEQFGPERLRQAIAELLQMPSLPPHIDAKLVDELPDTPGVYIFYGDNRRPLYIGKSTSIRSRVMNHFSSALRIRKEMKLAMQIKDIDWIETSGEVGALLLESRMIKEKLPSMNIKLRRSRDLCAWQLSPNERGVLTPQLVRHQDLRPGVQDNLYGLFYSRREALQTLQSIAKKNNLCEGLLGLEKIVPGKPCFGYQVKQCLGACIGEEPLAQYHLRLQTILTKFKVQVWPFKSPVGIKEGEHIHIIDHWCFLGTATNEEEVFELIQHGQAEFDLDIYKIVKKQFQKLLPHQLIKLPPRLISE